MLKKQLFLTALIFWFGVLIINLIRQPVNNKAGMIDFFWSEKILWKNRFDIVVAGDSRTLIGISPQAMQSVLPAYKIGNLGFAALVYSQDYMDYIRSTLRSSAKDRIIVLGFSPRSLLSKEKSICSFRNLYNQARIPLKMELDQRSIWLQILFFRLSEDDLNSFANQGNTRCLFVYFKSGWIASRLFPERAKGSRNQYKKDFMKSKIDEELIEVISRNTEVWTREGIKVVGIRMPISPGLFTIEEEMSGFDEQNIRRRFEKSGGIWLNPDLSYFVVYDGSHLRYDSAVSYSESLAQKLKKLLIDRKQ